MARVVVSVMPKPEILDPQGKAVHRALPRLGFEGDPRRPPGQALRARGRGRGHRGQARRDPRHRREAAVQPGDRELRGRRPRDGVDRGGPPVRIGVVTFPGSLDDVDAARAVTLAGGEPVALWHGDHDLQGVDAVVLPGGFSYGDYLRCGAIARFAPVMTDIIEGAKEGSAGPRHLQRLPDPVRVAPPARRADPQRPHEVRLPRPAPADRERLDLLDLRLRGGRRGHDRAQER